MNIDEYQPPCDVEAEQAVLGSLLIDPDAYYDVAEILEPTSFYRPPHQWIYEAIGNLYGRSEPLDLLTLSAELRRIERMEDSSQGYIVDLINTVPTSINIEHYAAIVAEKAARRRLIHAAGQVAKVAYNQALPIDEAIATAEAAVFDAGNNANRGTVLSPRRYMSDYIDSFMADVVSTDTPRIIGSGLLDLDRFLGGFERPHQYLIAGRTSMGKSSLALGIALHAAMRQGKRVLLFSLEMSQEQITNRLISLMTRIPVERLKPARRRELSTQDQALVMKAGGKLADSSIYIDATAGIRPSDVRARAARIYAAHGLDMVIVDHMHIVQANQPTGNEVQDLGAISIDLANIYKSLNVVGLTLAQLNRGVDARAIKRPMLSDLRQSGQIEENAYAVLFIHRDSYYDDTAPVTDAEVIIAKNRDGATGSVTIGWKPEMATFVSRAHPGMETL